MNKANLNGLDLMAAAGCFILGSLLTMGFASFVGGGIAVAIFGFIRYITSRNRNE